MTLVNKKSLIKTASTISGITLISRILGFVRDAVIAGVFGTGALTDVFFVSFRLPNLMRKLFSEGSLTIAFVPFFMKLYKQKGKKTAFEFACSFASVILLFISFMVVMGFILTPFLVKFLAPGFMGTPDKSELVVYMVRIMAPFVLIVCISALGMGVLNALGHFSIPAFQPVVLNLSIIISALFFHTYFQIKITALAYGVLLGGVFQLFLLIPVLIKKGVLVKCRINFYINEIKALTSKIIPSVFGASSYQINIFVGTVLATFLPDGSVSYLYYADRLVQFPLALFALSGAIVSLPTLSGFASSGNISRFKSILVSSVRLLIFIIIPAAVGLIVLNEIIVGFLFERGEFDSGSTLLTARALMFYGMGLPAFSVLKYILTVFNALSDIGSTVKVSVFSILLNLLLSLILMQFYGYSGVALGTSVTAYFELYLLVIILGKKHGYFILNDIKKSCIKATIASLFMGFSVKLLSIVCLSLQNNNFIFQIFMVIMLIITGAFIYALVSSVLKNNELESVMGLFRREK